MSTSKVNLPIVTTRVVHSREYLHQGRLTGAVLTADAMDRATTHRQGHVIQGHHARETFGDGLHLQDVITHVVLLRARRGDHVRSTHPGADRPAGRPDHLTGRAGVAPRAPVLSTPEHRSRPA